MRLFISVIITIFLSACAARFGEQHLFATIDPTTNQVVNIFRVHVKGSAELSNARYIAGFYDERAVDLFFNEVKASELSDSDTKRGADAIFKTVDCAGKDVAACQAAQDQVLRVVPVGSKPGNEGAFVLILSTNADAIAGTIGAFAENESVVQSAMFLATGARRKEAAAITARSGIVVNARNASIAELDALITSASAATTSTARTTLYLAALQAAAAGLAPNAPPNFATEAEARSWFSALPRRAVP